MTRAWGAGRRQRAVRARNRRVFMPGENVEVRLDEGIRDTWGIANYIRSSSNGSHIVRLHGTTALLTFAARDLRPRKNHP